MKDRSASKSRLFLIEFLIIIVFFAISGAICMNLFAKAKSISVNSSELTNAVISAQNAAEAFKSEGGGDTLASLLDAEIEGDTLTIRYGENFEPLKPGGAPVYTLQMRLSVENGLETAIVTVWKSEKEIHSVTVKRYQNP